MKIRLIALDLDGTLLDSRKRLPERNRKALEACIEKGIYIVPCTGRIAKGIPDEVKGIPGVRYAITVNGGMIEDMQEKRVLDQHLLDRETTLDVMKLVMDRHVMYDAYIDGMGISEARFYDHLEEYNIAPEIRELIHATRRKVPNIIEYVKQWEGGIDKINFFFPNMEERAEVRAILEERGDVLVSSSQFNNLEINALGAAKGEALMRLASILGLKPEETMAFGDGDNDRSMIRMAGLGVVMQNGEAELKALADYVTSSNDDAGVGRAIEELVLSNCE